MNEKDRQQALRNYKDACHEWERGNHDVANDPKWLDNLNKAFAGCNRDFDGMIGWRNA